MRKPGCGENYKRGEVCDGTRRLSSRPVRDSCPGSPSTGASLKSTPAMPPPRWIQGAVTAARRERPGPRVVIDSEILQNLTELIDGQVRSTKRAAASTFSGESGAFPVSRARANPRPVDALICAAG